MWNAFHAGRLVFQFSIRERSSLPEIRNDVAFIASAVNIAGANSAELDRKDVPKMQNKGAVISSHLAKVAQFALRVRSSTNQWLAAVSVAANRCAGLPTLY